ncbi:MAG: tRNA (adenosine(37)-N6)-threonylcarbamoyltransferase complex dimerization subunit type 1 TsaB [Pseudomonadota bacterium]
MKLLAIDTATDACTVALAIDDQARCAHTHEPRVHAKQLLAMIDELLREADMALGGLDGIVVGVGPGSFTGVRIGCSTAQGLALAGDIQVLPVSSLATVAAQFVPHRFAEASPERTAQRVIVAQDARMGELYWGAFEPSPADVLSTRVSDRADPPERLLARAKALSDGEKPLLLAGTGAQAHPSLRELLRVHDTCAPALPSARDALALGARDLLHGPGGVPPEQALPVYFRPPV